MQKDVQLKGKALSVRVTDEAERELVQAEKALRVEMDLAFSCLIRKAVTFEYSDQLEGCTPVSDKLAIAFHSSVRNVCGVDDENRKLFGMTPVEDLSRFVPRWLHIDFRNGEWIGEFGYTKEKT